MAKRKEYKIAKSAPENSDKQEIYVSAYTSGSFHTSSFFRQHWLETLLILLLSFVLYHSSLPFGYVLDDQMVITGNSFTKKGFSGIGDILTTESFTGYFGEKKELVQGNRYRPLSIITFAIEYGIIGDLKPSLSHFINILLYGLTGIIFMMVLTMMFRNYKSEKWFMAIPFLASLFFIFHPIHTEAVANIKGRDEIMSMLFSLIALYGSLRFMDNRSNAWLAVAIISYFAGLLSKENAITFLAVIPLTVYFFSQTDWSKTGKLVLFLLLTTIAYLVLRFNTAGIPKFGQEINDIMNNPFLGMKPGEKFGSILYTLGKYLLLLIFPHPLSHDYYPYAIPKVSIFNIWSFTSLVGYLLLIYFGLKNMARKSVYSYSILFYLFTLTIVSNILINLGTFMNERFIFMASAGYCIAVAYFLSWHLPKLIKGSGDKLAMVLSLMLILGYSIKTYLRVPVWKDALSLNKSAVEVSSNSARANSFMSTALFEEYKLTKDRQRQIKLLDEAELYGAKAVKILPDYQNANLMLIGVVAERYKLDNDIKRYIKDMKPIFLRRPDITFIKEFSDYLKGRGHDADLFPFYLEVGTGLLEFKDRRRDYALMFLNYAYEINPNNLKVNEGLAVAYELSGNMQEANRFKTAASYLK